MREGRTQHVLLDEQGHQTKKHIDDDDGREVSNAENLFTPKRMMVQGWSTVEIHLSSRDPNGKITSYYISTIIIICNIISMVIMHRQVMLIGPVEPSSYTLVYRWTLVELSIIYTFDHGSSNLVILRP